MAVVDPLPGCIRDDCATAEHLNRECFCITLDEAALGRSLQAELGDAEIAGLMAERPHLFARTPVFVPAKEAEAMQAIINAIEATTVLTAYRQAAFARAPGIARRDFGPRGVFMGYDFHLSAAGPQLIEVNTNAGGAFLNALLGRAQLACCAEVERAMGKDALSGFEPAVAAMFEAEWRAQGRGDRPHRIAIVDDAPAGEYLYPEFLVAQRMLERQGFEAVVADAADLRFENGVLLAENRPVDLVYNRVVDFALEEARHAALRYAYLAGAVVLTPNPHNHALLADKRNLTLLSDPDALRSWGLSESHIRALAGVPRAKLVSSEEADALWAERKRLFFKPACGHGGKAVYRGDKLTRSVWGDILSGGYIAQELAPPTERTIQLDAERVQRKLDIRLYTYAGKVLLAAARLYQGQTTNFRTPGGGFAPVFFI